MRMLNISKISTNLILVSLISSLMVFWLGSRYLSDAHAQFSGAMQLQRSVVPEGTLFEVAQSLDLERATIQRILTSSIEYDEEVDRLDAITLNTRSLFERARLEITNSRPKGSEKIQYRYSNEAVDNILQILTDRFQRISFTKSVIISQIFLPPSQRDETMRMQLFDAYVKLIDAVNNLRLKTHALPDENYRGVLSAHDTKNAIWTISDSVDQISTLIGSYLLKAEQSALDSLNYENLSLRILQQRERTEKSLLELSDMVEGNVIAGFSANAVNALVEDYEVSFLKMVKTFSIAIANDMPVNFDPGEWRSVSSTTKMKVRELTDAALFDTLSRAGAIKRKATISLLINTLLVLLCGAMAFASFRIAKKIQYQANHDDLTGVWNRRKFSELLETMLHKTDVLRKERLVLITIDLNGFKTINDTLGHAIGDRLLRNVAKRLQSVISDNMELARMGGDEFSISYTTGDRSEIYGFACRLRDSFEPSFSIDDTFINVCPSIGYSCYPDDAKTVEQLHVTSDFAMFSAKQSSGKAIQPYDKQTAAQFERRSTIEKDLIAALENNELELYYQPQFNLDLNRINAAEALIRWNHPDRGTVPPIQFIEIAEESGLMPAIGDWVLNEACRQAAEWNRIENFSIRVAINVSVYQLTQSDFVEKVIAAMNRHDVSAECLELEITESAVMLDMEWIVKSLEQLKKAGLRIALDDFGTGYSSLSQLQALPLDTLKIDKSFISNLDAETGSTKSVTETIASIAKVYELETVAEGIETAGQLFEVKTLGINVAQGYFFSRPVPSGQLLDAVAKVNREAMLHGFDDAAERRQKAA